MIQAKVIADSSNELGNRITTMIVTFPRFILAELNTHRMFSRNSASSRAIPFEKMLKSVQENPFIPIAWQKDHKGMQGTEYYSDEEVRKCGIIEQWLGAKDMAINRAVALNELGVTKQLCNRLLEPFMWHTVLITATEWENFFALRCPKYEINCGPDDTDDSTLCTARSWKDLMSDKGGLALDFDTTNVLERLLLNKGQAEIHMMALAESIWDAMNESTPKQLKAGEWHIPFGNMIPSNLEELNKVTNTGDYYPEQTRIKIATAMCARVSYTVVGEEDKTPNYENDIKLHDRLATSGHWSPFEHCAKVMTKDEYNSRLHNSQGNHGWSGNFRGFIQYRKMFNDENVTK